MKASLFLEKISVPIINLETFDPDKAPTLEQTIIDNGDGQYSVNMKFLQPYIDFFLDFIKNKTEKEAAIVGMMEMKDKKESVGTV